MGPLATGDGTGTESTTGLRLTSVGWVSSYEHVSCGSQTPQRQSYPFR